MKFFIINTDYTQFLQAFYSEHPGLETRSYDEQAEARRESLFAQSSFYASNLRCIGHDAWVVYANNESMQRAWAREHGVQVGGPKSPDRPARRALQHARQFVRSSPLRVLTPVSRPLQRSLALNRSWLYDILAAQIKHYQPDVILNQDMTTISASFLSEMKPGVKLIVGQNGTAYLQRADLECYDLILSLLPENVTRFRRAGIKSELHRVAFEPQVLTHLNGGGKTSDLSFVGSLSRMHRARTSLIETLANRFERMRIWGSGVEELEKESAVRKRYEGEAWGREMYGVLHNSKMTLNYHGDDIAHAANLRLYEATGVGTLLITDWKPNLQELFELGKEVVAYRNAEECAELIQYYLDHDDEREIIARAGQQRTLREHTYYQRMEELVGIVGKYL